MNGAQTRSAVRALRKVGLRAGLLLVVTPFLSCGLLSGHGGSLGQAQEPALGADVRIDRLVVLKSAGLMRAYDGESLVRTYSVGTGTGGTGPKRWEGDNRTPEGEYRIDRRHRSQRFHSFLHVSYPNREDRRRYRRLQREGRVPEGRGIGSAIGVHGQPSHVLGFLASGDWTAGCVAVSDEEAEELYQRVAQGARITIHP